MAVDWFLVDARHAVPAEFAAWEVATERHRALVYRAIDAEEGGEEYAALEAAGLEAKREADRLEQIARDAWKRTWRVPGA
ncbi:hypothetical protein SB783_37440 [Paraburkholderia sp. SIMBA_009]